MPPGTLVSSYDGGIVKEAGSPGDFNDQEGYNGVEAIDLYGEGKKYQVNKCYIVMFIMD